jgi:hypothetical protein
MGAEAKCAVTFGKKTSSGKARLETTVLQVRAEGLKLDVPFAAVKNLAVHDGLLTITLADGTLTLRLGAAAQKWADKILHPPSRLTKLGVKPDWRASVLGTIDSGFLAELKEAVTTLSVGRAAPNADAVFFAVACAADLKKLGLLKRALKPNGALWIVRPKGHPEVTERGVMAAGKAAGLVDVKVVAFSSTHTAEKFVIPVKDRAKSSNPGILKS